MFDLKKTSRQAALKAWLAYHGIRNCDLAEKLAVSPSMISRLIRGQRAPANRLRQLLELGIPVEYLLTPSGPVGRPRKQKKSD